MGIVWENTTPSTELPCDFCPGIGPLQLGVVLVLKKNIYSLFIFHFRLVSSEPKTSEDIPQTDTTDSSSSSMDGVSGGKQGRRCSIQRAEFAIGRHTFELIYSQSLCWYTFVFLYKLILNIYLCFCTGC